MPSRRSVASRIHKISGGTGYTGEHRLCPARFPRLGKHTCLKYFSDLRVDDVQGQDLREHPFQQFIDGFTQGVPPAWREFDN